jgi:hypothetical protein
MRVSMRLRLTDWTSWPDATSSVAACRVKNSAATPRVMSEMVKILPAGPSGCTSAKPTAARVMTVMYSASSRLQPSSRR